MRNKRRPWLWLVFSAGMFLCALIGLATLCRADTPPFKDEVGETLSAYFDDGTKVDCTAVSGAAGWYEITDAAMDNANVTSGVRSCVVYRGVNAAGLDPTTDEEAFVLGGIRWNGTNTVDAEAEILVDTSTTLDDMVDDIGVAGAGLAAIPWNASWDAEVQSEVNDGLVGIGLDHLLFASVTGSDVADNSALARLVSKGATADWDSFVNTTDSLEAIRDRGDTEWAGGGGGGEPISPSFVDQAHTWRFEASDQLTAGNTIYEVETFEEGLLAMDFDRVIPRGTSINTVTIVGSDPAEGDDIDFGTPLADASQRKVHLPINEVNAGTYLVAIKIVTRDSQQFTRRGRLTITEALDD